MAEQPNRKRFRDGEFVNRQTSQSEEKDENMEELNVYVDDVIVSSQQSQAQLDDRRETYDEIIRKEQQERADAVAREGQTNENRIAREWAYTNYLRKRRMEQIMITQDARAFFAQINGDLHFAMADFGSNVDFVDPNRVPITLVSPAQPLTRNLDNNPMDLD